MNVQCMRLQSIFCIFFLTVGFFPGFGQSRTKANHFEGYIITADSVRKEVAIEVEDTQQPWSFQQDVRYFDKSLLNGGRVKRELKKECNPGEVLEYGFQNRRFVSVQYYIKGADEDNKLKEAFGKFKGEKNIDFFAEVIQEGNVLVAKFHIPPVIADEDYDSDEKMRSHIKTCEEQYDLLVFRKGLKPISISDISFKDFFADCAFVVKKYDEQRYKLKPVKGIKSGIKSVFSPDKLMGAALKTAVDAILADYDGKCRK